MHNEGVTARSVRKMSVGLLVALLVFALVPMVLISFYDHSYADDWHYGVDAYLALQAGGGIIDALQAAWAEVCDTFSTWQGTYSAIFLMALQPGVFSEAAYGWGAIAIIATLIASTFYVGSVLLRGLLGADRASWIACSCLVLLLQTQLLPSPVEGFWWYNSAIYYTFYHALMLVMLGLCVTLGRARTRKHELSRAGVAVRTVALSLLAAFVAGGNFVTGVVCGLMLLGAVVVTARTSRRRALLMVPALLLFAAGFALSLAAPGNVARQTTQFPEDALGVLPTLLHSGFAGFEYVVLWCNGLLVLALAAAVPFMVGIARRSPCSFARPWAPPLLSLLVFMASFTPTFYSMGTVGPGRVQNIRYDLFVLLVFVCVMWFVGWACRRFEVAARKGGEPRATGWGPFEVAAGVAAAADVSAGGNLITTGVDRSVDGALAGDGQSATIPARYRLGYLLVLVVLLCGALTSFALDERHAEDLVSLSATSDLLNGEAAEYDRQFKERDETLRAADDGTVYVPFYTAGPKVLFMGDIHDNMDNYINYRLSQWYGKEAILGYYASLN